MWESDHKEGWVPKNWCFRTMVLEKTLERPLDCKGDQTSQSWRKSTLHIHWKDYCWSWNTDTLATWCKELTHLKRPWCWERLKVGGEGDDRGSDGWMASPMRWSWVWVGSMGWWWTEDLACCSLWGRKESDVTERLNWTDDALLP